MKIRIFPILLLLTTCLLALLFGLALAVLPTKLTVVVAGVVISILGIAIILLLPDAATPRQRLALGILFIAFATKFLWPNFAYIPIDSLPTKNPQRLVWAVAIAFWVYSLATTRE